MSGVYFGVSTMRLVLGFVAAVAIFGGSVSAQAYEKFIPLGAGYSTDVSTLPPINSDDQAITVQSDVFETELYNKQLEDKRRDSYLQRFMFGTENPGADFSIDY
jgi:hypothetical protein